MSDKDAAKEKRNMSTNQKDPPQEERFRTAMKKILAVPKEEIQKREAEYRAEQALKKKRRS